MSAERLKNPKKTTKKNTYCAVIREHHKLSSVAVPNFIYLTHEYYWEGGRNDVPVAPQYISCSFARDLNLQWFRDVLSIEQKEPWAVITWVRVEELFQLRVVIINVERKKKWNLCTVLLIQYMKEEEESDYTHVHHGVFDNSANILPPFCHVRVVFIQIGGKG